MAGRAGSGHRWLTIALLAVASGALAAPPPASADPPTPVKNAKAPRMDKTTLPPAPEQALLDYLGRYADAADGLDPLGLAEPEAERPADADPRERP